MLAQDQKVYLAYVAALMTTLLSVLGVCFLIYSAWWHSSARSVRAEVIDIKQDVAGNSSYLLSYSDESGQRCEAEMDPFLSFIPLGVGNEIDICYRADRDGDVRLDSFADKWGMGIFLFLWGLICSVPFWIILKRLKKSRL